MSGASGAAHWSGSCRLTGPDRCLAVGPTGPPQPFFCLGLAQLARELLPDGLLSFLLASAIDVRNLGELVPDEVERRPTRQGRTVRERPVLETAVGQMRCVMPCGPGQARRPSPDVGLAALASSATATMDPQRWPNSSAPKSTGLSMKAVRAPCAPFAVLGDGQESPGWRRPRFAGRCRPSRTARSRRWLAKLTRRASRRQRSSRSDELAPRERQLRHRTRRIALPTRAASALSASSLMSKEADTASTKTSPSRTPNLVLKCSEIAFRSRMKACNPSGRLNPAACLHPCDGNVPFNA